MADIAQSVYTDNEGIEFHVDFVVLNWGVEPDPIGDEPGAPPEIGITKIESRGRVLDDFGHLDELIFRITTSILTEFDFDALRYTV